ncbi:type II toxin-antitoxin system RelE/ParE family toxin [Acidaminobacter sp. JC074]|uniref:type II toxin-antitoxin system RelE/ParE family toxin n=1 Tax=Acidaminobacter sp. JC074 TaxID=2530199 RepID=UPI001F107166|nr:type II toxin-antitoxin system RelE/ParE family toxin [Acidaminobacter sp. JC074]MCH4890636.1 type II toxin-antitoxin system RelE/ParE family toxin [Acidaminobacter sp. JC074]
MKKNKYHILYTPLSKSDLTDIFDYIFEDNFDAAINLLDRIEKGISNLSFFPFSGVVPRDSRLNLKGYRLLIIDRYTVFYKIDDVNKEVVIHRILSTYRDYDSLN